MIGSIRGIVKKSSSEGKIIVETASGIGYELFYGPAKVLDNDPISIYISSIFKESGVELFGHKTFEEKKVFETLLKVKGVGPKTAYSLLTNLGTKNLCDAIFFERQEILKKIPGIGAKTAAQIILDLKKGISSLYKEISESSPLSNDEKNQNKKVLILDEAVGALVGLGVSEIEAFSMAKNIVENSQMTRAEEVVREVLKKQKQKH